MDTIRPERFDERRPLFRRDVDEPDDLDDLFESVPDVRWDDDLHDGQRHEVAERSVSLAELVRQRSSKPPSRLAAGRQQIDLRWNEVRHSRRLIPIVVAAVAALAVAGTWLFLRSNQTGGSIDDQLPRASSASAAPGSGAPAAASAGGGAAAVSTTTTSVRKMVVVHVTGAVVHPGVVQLDQNQRVADALVAAGGLRPDADGARINLAAGLADGSRLYVPIAGETVPLAVVPAGGGGAPGTGAAGGTGTAGGASAGPVDLNQATAAQLDALPGIGPSTAAAIVAYRDQHQRFSKVDELLEVRGIGPAKLEQLRPLVVVG